MGAVGLQTYIWNNNIKSTLLLLGFPLLLLGMVYAFVLLLMGFGYLPTDVSAGALMLSYAPLAIGAALIWFVIAYFSYQTIIDLSTGARPVSRQALPRVYNLLENLAISRGMQTPTLRVIDIEAMNAFATGLHEGQYSVTVTTGLLDALDDQELEAVLAHEMTHVINRDVRLMMIASIFAGIITLLAQIIYRSIIWSSWTGGGDRRRRGGGAGLFILVALAAAAIGWALALVIKMAISRRREYVADAGAVELTKNPDAMISALQKISGHSEIHAPSSVRSMFLDDDEGVMGLFATHPPIAKRIEALVRYAGGVVREPPPAGPAPPAGFSPEPHPHPDAPLTGEEGPWGRRPGPWG